MNKKLFYILSFIPTLFLASCGYGLKQIYDGNLYNSPIWENNYYRTYEQGSDVISSKDEMINDGHLPFTSFSDPNFLLEEPNFKPGDNYSEETNSFSMTNALGNVSDSFKQGYKSKLFDGKLYCYGRYETVRVQIDEAGCGMMFANELVKGDYFLIQFKSELDFKSDENIFEHYDDITLHIGFIFKNNQGYNKDTYNYRFENIPTNCGEAFDYVTFGFSLEKINIERLCGLSISYTLNHETYNESMSTSLAHALFIYEIMMPHSIWR